MNVLVFSVFAFFLFCFMMVRRSGKERYEVAVPSQKKSGGLLQKSRVAGASVAATAPCRKTDALKTAYSVISAPISVEECVSSSVRDCDITYRALKLPFGLSSRVIKTFASNDDKGDSENDKTFHKNQALTDLQDDSNEPDDLA